MNRLQTAVFGRSDDGRDVTVYTLTNTNGLALQFLNFGGLITSLRVPDRSGAFADVVLGFDTLAPYLVKHPFFGALVGRCANRIANARFTLNGREYVLAANNGPNHLHGGIRGFDKVHWDAAPTPDNAGVVLTRTSPDGEEGYPGRLDARVTYKLTDANELVIEYYATTDAPTPVNMTQHSYFNLGGEGSGDILSHELTIHAERYTPVDAFQIPTGELAPVENTPFDFRQPCTIGARIGDSCEQLHIGNGYDQNFVLTKQSGPALQSAARVVHHVSGRSLDVATTQPGVQFYSGNRLKSVAGKHGHIYEPRAGFCLETQHFPDSPNQPAFPSVILEPGGHYEQVTVFTFGVIS